MVSLAGRPKLTTLEKIRQKPDFWNTAFGRGVWCFDSHENVLAKKFLKGIYDEGY